MNERRVTKNVSIENAQLIFRNFSGKGSQYNKEGDCNFGVLLDDELAHQMAEDGWNIKFLKPREDDPEQHEQAWISVKVKWEPFPPQINLITEKGKRKLDYVTSKQLDWSRILSADVIIRPYNYPAMGGRPGGVSAYLSALYVTIDQGRFYEKYANLPDLDEECEEYGG